MKKKRGTCRQCDSVYFNKNGESRCHENSRMHDWTLDSTCSDYYPSFNSVKKPRRKPSLTEVIERKMIFVYTAVALGIMIGGLFLNYIRGLG